MAKEKEPIARLFDTFLTTINLIQRCLIPLTGCIAGENKEAKPQVLCAVYLLGFMQIQRQCTNVFSNFGGICLGLIFYLVTRY